MYRKFPLCSVGGEWLCICHPRFLFGYAVIPQIVGRRDCEQKPTFSDREAYTHTSERGNGDRTKKNKTKEENRGFCTVDFLFTQLRGGYIFFDTPRFLFGYAVIPQPQRLNFYFVCPILGHVMLLYTKNVHPLPCKGGAVHTDSAATAQALAI